MENVERNENKKIMKFSQFGLDKWLMNNINYLQYSKPSEIQQKVIPKLLKGDEENIIGIAKTGTGKTAAFCLPLLNKLAMDPCGIFAVILEPTRELAVQVMEKLKVYSAGFNLRAQMIIGGVDITEQLIKMDSIPHIIVATPGRLAYLLQFSTEQFKFIQNLRYLVLDEFDQLLNDTILPDINTILTHLPKERQTLFFSATLNPQIHTDEFFSDFYTGKRPLFFDCSKSDIGSGNKEVKMKSNNSVNSDNLDDSQKDEREQMSVEDDQNSKSKLPDELTQKYVLIPRITKEHYLIYLMQNEFKKKYTIIFVSSCKQCHFISHLLELFNVKVSVIHSKMPQKKRFTALEKFKGKLNNVLVATDIASRGLDIPFVDLVVNYDIPRNPDDYIHRVGRTARAGKQGLAVSFVSQYDVELILTIEEIVGKKMEELPVNENDVMANLSLVTKGVKIVQMKIYESGFDEKIEKRKSNYQGKEQKGKVRSKNKIV